MTGTLVPPWFVLPPVSLDDLITASIFWGIAMGFTILAIVRAANQTVSQWRRARKVTAYMIFIWLEIVVSAILGGISWGYLRETIPPR